MLVLRSWDIPLTGSLLSLLRAVFVFPQKENPIYIAAAIISGLEESVNQRYQRNFAIYPVGTAKSCGMYESQYRLAAESEIVVAKCLDEPAWLPISEDICGQSVPIFGDSNCKLPRNVVATSSDYVCKGTSTSNPFLCAADFFLQSGSCKEAVR